MFPVPYWSGSAVYQRWDIGKPLHGVVEVVEDLHERGVVHVERHLRHVLGGASTHSVNMGWRCAGRSGRWSIEFVGRRWSNILVHCNRRRAGHGWRRIDRGSRRCVGHDGLEQRFQREPVLLARHT